MAASDQNRQDWLNREWDALVRGDEVGINPEYAGILRGLHRDDPTPGPSPEFVRALWAELESRRGGANVRRIWSAPRLALVAAAIALLLLSAGLLGVLLNDDAPPDDGFGVITEPSATPTPPVPPSRETLTSGGTPTEIGQQTPPVAIVSPTPPPGVTVTPTPDATGAVETATVDPDATVPTGPAPPIQAGGGPAYGSLADYVNNADLIVVGRVSGPSSSNDPNFIYYPIDVDEIVRGSAGGELLVHGLSGNELAGDQFVLFLRGPYDGNSGPYYAIDLFVPLADGLIVPFDWETVEYHPRAAHRGQPAQALIDEIHALWPVEDEMYALLEQHGWTAIRKGYLWPQVLPKREDFSQRGPMPRRAPTWGALLAASERVGLDFSDLAGQTVQVLPVVIERDRVDGEHLIVAEFVIVDQRVVGAWIVVLPDRDDRVFGLDERGAVLDIPILIPTPEPTPTFAVPSSESVNPAQFYRLADTETFMLCWSYCDERPVTVAFRDSIVAALDRELLIQPVESNPIPTPPGGPEPATDEFIWIVFDYLDPNRYASRFGYDRVNGVVLLPGNAGWVTAPPELAAALDGLEPPPPPTKP